MMISAFSVWNWKNSEKSSVLRTSREFGCAAAPQIRVQARAPGTSSAKLASPRNLPLAYLQQ